MFWAFLRGALAKLQEVIETWMQGNRLLSDACNMSNSAVAEACAANAESRPASTNLKLIPLRM